MIAALGMMLFLEAVARTSGARSSGDGHAVWRGRLVVRLPVTAHRLILLAAAAACDDRALRFLTRTTAGAAIRATAQDPEGALLVGIDTSRIAMATFAISAAMAAVAGVLIAPISLVYPSMGTLITLKAFVIVVLGGMGSVTGALIGGYLLALAESWVALGFLDLPGSDRIRRPGAGVHVQADRPVQGVGVMAGLVKWLALVVAVILPLVLPNEYYLQILTQGYVFAISACGLNVILGLAGQLSLAHAGFFGIGAYAVALLATKAGVSFWLGLPAGVALCALSGYAIGSICLRSKGHYFAIFTMAVGIIIHLVIQKWESLTTDTSRRRHSRFRPDWDGISLQHRELVYGLFSCVPVLATTRLGALTSPNLDGVPESEPMAAAVCVTHAAKTWHS